MSMFYGTIWVHLVIDNELICCVVFVDMQGVVIKFNANQRYATTAITASIIREIASKCHVPLQVNDNCLRKSVFILRVKMCHCCVCLSD